MQHVPGFNLDSRRRFLETAGLGFGSVALTSLLHSEGLLGDESSTNPLAPTHSHFRSGAKAVIWLFQTGSPSQVDTFDYKPELQKRNGPSLDGADPKTGFFTTSGKCLKSPFKFNQHGESGAWISEIFPNIARHADDIAFIYSCFSRSNNHTPAMLELNSGFIRQGFPSLGSWLTYGLGSENSNLPAYVVMHGKKPRGGDPVWSSGFLPSVYQATALDPRQPKPINNLQRSGELTDPQQRSLLDALRAANSKHARTRPFDRDLSARLESFELAYRMQVAAPEAFDIGRESKTTRTAYGSGQFADGCLIARRLVERGVRMVQLFYGSGQPWDAHGNIMDHKRDAGKSDQPIAALLGDLKSRGMLEETLVIWGGEFGRTPTAQGARGRNHHATGFSIWLAGGGVKGGMIHGQTDEMGMHAVENRMSVHDLHATILHLAGIDHERLTYRYSGRDFRLTDVHGEIAHKIIA